MQTPGSTPIETRLQKVNDFFNRKLAYLEDQEIWGVPDYWATPMESLSKAKADCEDYVIFNLEIHRRDGSIARNG